MRTKIFILSIILCNFILNAQSISTIYKIDGLLKRIGDADTIYVVNFWATWCKPCVQELPAFDSLLAKTKNTPVKILLVSLDFKEELYRQVNPFLRGKNIRCESVLLDEINGNDFINKISDHWTGAIPATLFKYGQKKTFLERKVNLGLLNTELGKLK